jgi:hypothetical protein
MRRTIEERRDIQARQKAVDDALRARGIPTGLAWWETVERLLALPAALVVPTLPTDAEAEALVDEWMRQQRAGQAGHIVPLDESSEHPRCRCGHETPHPALEAGDVVYQEVDYYIHCDGCGEWFTARCQPFRWVTTGGNLSTGQDDDHYPVHGDMTV